MAASQNNSLQALTVQRKEQASIRTDSGGGGGETQDRPNGGAQECHLFLAGNHAFFDLEGLCRPL